MKKYRVKIKGVTPYMQHRMDDVKLEEWEKTRGLIMERQDVANPDKVRAEYFSHRNQSGKCFIPADQIRGSLINAGSYVKAKVGGRSKSMKQIVAAMFMVKSILDYAGKYVGIGSYRPTHNGMFGRFEIVTLEQIIE